MLESIAHKVECLAKNIYFEARGESKLGMVAVAHVTINRTKAPGFPADVCSVVYQPGQFSWTATRAKIVNTKIFQDARNIAMEAILGVSNDPTKGALSFHSKEIETGWKKRITTRIGNHVFYR